MGGINPKKVPWVLSYSHTPNSTTFLPAQTLFFRPNTSIWGRGKVVDRAQSDQSSNKQTSHHQPTWLWTEQPTDQWSYHRLEALAAGRPADFPLFHKLKRVVCFCVSLRHVHIICFYCASFLSVWCHLPLVSLIPGFNRADTPTSSGGQSATWFSQITWLEKNAKSQRCDPFCMRNDILPANKTFVEKALSPWWMRFQGRNLWRPNLRVQTPPETEKVLSRSNHPKTIS